MTFNDGFVFSLNFLDRLPYQLDCSTEQCSFGNKMQSYPPFQAQAQAQPNQQFQRQAFQPVIAFQPQTSVNPSGKN